MNLLNDFASGAENFKDSLPWEISHPSPKRPENVPHSTPIRDRRHRCQTGKQRLGNWRCSRGRNWKSTDISEDPRVGGGHKEKGKEDEGKILQMLESETKQKILENLRSESICGERIEPTCGVWMTLGRSWRQYWRRAIQTWNVGSILSPQMLSDLLRFPSILFSCCESRRRVKPGKGVNMKKKWRLCSNQKPV